MDVNHNLMSMMKMMIMMIISNKRNLDGHHTMDKYSFNISLIKILKAKIKFIP